MNPLRTLALTAFALFALCAGRASAVAVSAGSTSLTVSSLGSDISLGSLFNSQTLTATSVTMPGPLTAPPAPTGSSAVLGIPGVSTANSQIVALGSQGSQGSQGEDFDGPNSLRIKLGPFSRPIPEARTDFLYALGLCAVAWAVLRSRRVRASAR